MTSFLTTGGIRGGSEKIGNQEVLIWDCPGKRSTLLKASKYTS
jgi:hypothetical protein